MGVREIVLIAQDTTDYGYDFHEDMGGWEDSRQRDGLAKLLEGLVSTLQTSNFINSESEMGVEWIRIMYAYPGYVNDRLVEVIANHPQVVPYLDMPLQHAHPAALRRMRRPANIDWVHRTLEKIRSAMPDLALRTTFIVGYPGETEHEFQTLLNFVEEIRFDRVGVFKFSFEPGTPSEPLGDPISAEVKQERWERLMTLQQGISLEKNQIFVGKTLDVLVEGQGDGVSLGRTYRDAPEIDGLVIIEGEIPVGGFVPVRINGAMVYDLSGVVETNHSDGLLGINQIQN
jgi:ribosomal protein S12 methylthiotransferase